MAKGTFECRDGSLVTESLVHVPRRILSRHQAATRKTSGEDTDTILLRNFRKFACAFARPSDTNQQLVQCIEPLVEDEFNHGHADGIAAATASANAVPATTNCSS